MRLGVNLGYWGAGNDADNLALAREARELAPHLVCVYLAELAAKLHSYYNAEKFLVEDENLKLARLALILATRQVLRNGLSQLGVSAPESMGRDAPAVAADAPASP